MDNRFSTWKRDSRRGNYSILMGTTVFALLGFSALALDISLITMAELQAQATADAASHAALVAFREHSDPMVGANAGNDAADFIVQRNNVGMGTATIDNIQYGEYHHDTHAFCGPGCFGYAGNVNAVKVELSRLDANNNAVDLLLAPMFGVDTHDVDADSITAQQQRAIMLVQDASCSMMGSWSGAAINVARNANLIFLAYLVNYPQSGDKLGLAQYASLGAVDPAAGGGGTSAWPAYNVPSWARLVEIEWNLPYLQDRIAGICDTYYGGYCPGSVHPTAAQIGTMTNPGVAMEQAIGQIRDHTDLTYFRGMVVFSDGYFNYGGGTPRAQAAASTAWDNYDVHIWTILYSNGGGSPSDMNSLVRGIGFFQNSPNVADLPAMYEEVAKSIPTVLVM